MKKALIVLENSIKFSVLFMPLLGHYHGWYLAISTTILLFGIICILRSLREHYYKELR